MTNFKINLMKNIFKILFICLSATLYSQGFKGEITYSNTYKSKNNQINNEQLSLMLGTTQNYFTQNGNYKSVTNGKLVLWQLYLNKENKLYSKMSNSEIAYWQDCNIQGDTVLKIEVNKNITTVLGLKCDEIILTCNSGIQKYYFNSKLPVDPNMFSGHKLGNWYNYISKSKAFPLKMIIENNQFIMTSIAIKIDNKEVPNSFFELPEGIKTEQMK
jgi:hypothetical protein